MIHDMERLEQNAMLVKLWTCLKQVEARQEALARPSTVPEAYQQEIEIEETNDDALIASLMRPRNQMVPLQQMLEEKNTDSLAANTKTAEALAASNKPTSSIYSPRGPSSPGK